MALLSPTTTTFFPNSPPNSTKLPVLLLSFSVSYTRFYNLSHSTNHSFSFPIHSHCPFQPLPISPNSTVVRPGRCRASSPGPPPPPRTDPPPETDSKQLKGSELAASFSKIQDRVQIFFAVLFWMSLFFWASAWDGRNRPNKGPKFRR